MKVLPSRHRAAFFSVDGAVFVNLLYNHSDDLDVTGTDVEELLAAHAADDIVIGRRLSTREAALVATGLGDAEAEAFARIIPDTQDRWTRRRRRRP